MSININIEDAFIEASQGFGPMAKALLSRYYPDWEKFQPFYPLVQVELKEFCAKVNELMKVSAGAPEAYNADSLEDAFTVVILLGSWVYKDEHLSASTPVASDPPATASPTAARPALKETGVCEHVGRKWGGFSFTATGLYKFVCGYECNLYPIAMAHKVLRHEYVGGSVGSKYTTSWAVEEYRKHGVTVSAASLFPAPGASALAPAPSGTPNPVHDPNLRNVVSEWKPTLNLDLSGLGLEVGQAGRYAVGDKDNARFFFIRRLNRESVLKGKFVWTKFRHHFSKEWVYVGDYVIRKEAGDTKEWVGVQKSGGVYNSDRSRLDRYVHKNVYVGEYEEDIQQVLNDPFKALTNYGKWIGACGYCGRKLTDPESRLRGIGPDCWEARGVDGYMNGIRLRQAGAQV